MLRHRAQRGAHLLAYRGGLVDLRRGVDIDRRFRGVNETCQQQQHRETTHARTPSDRQSATIVHLTLPQADCHEVVKWACYRPSIKVRSKRARRWNPRSAAADPHKSLL